VKPAAIGRQIYTGGSVKTAAVRTYVTIRARFTKHLKDQEIARLKLEDMMHRRTLFGTADA
jgi:hypothetical protein